MAALQVAMDAMEHDRQGQRGAFVIRRHGEVLAQLTYARAGPGARLVEQAVEWARAEAVELVARCDVLKK